MLTRLPAPHRIPLEDAHRYLAENFAGRAELAALPGSDYWPLMARLAANGFGGGKTYDALIASAVHRAGASVLLTWNTRDYHSVAPAGLQVVEP